jgi:chromosome partitioning protein
VKIVSVLNHKGGVGKTTFTGCVGQALALSGFSTLVIDNDSQHNLSSMMSAGVRSPNIADVYAAPLMQAPETLLASIRRTEIDNLHIITSSSDLRDSSAPSPDHLQKTIQVCGLGRFYRFVLVDNAPGLDRLQEASVLASDEIFVPTELRQFAVDGIAEMEQTLAARFGSTPRITRIIPNFYKDTKRHNSFILALNRLFPGRVTQTAIPIDPVFDELITENKILFLHRLYSRGAAYYLKIMHELFDVDEDAVWDAILEKRRERLSDEARRRFWERAGAAGQVRDEAHGLNERDGQ